MPRSGLWSQGHKVRLGIAAYPYEVEEARFAADKLGVGQPAAERFITQPYAIGVDDIALAILGNLANAPVSIIFIDLCSIHPIGLSGEPHDAAQLVQRRLAFGTTLRDRAAVSNDGI